MTPVPYCFYHNLSFQYCMHLFRILFYFSSLMMPLYAFLMTELLMIRAALNKSFAERNLFNSVFCKPFLHFYFTINMRFSFSTGFEKGVFEEDQRKRIFIDSFVNEGEVIRLFFIFVFGGRLICLIKKPISLIWKFFINKMYNFCFEYIFLPI